MKDVKNLLMDDDEKDEANAAPSFIRPGKRRAAQPKTKEGGTSPSKGESGKITGKKMSGKLPGAQAMFDAIDREEDASGSDEYDIGVTFNAGDYDELGGGKNKKVSKVEEENEQMDEY